MPSSIKEEASPVFDTLKMEKSVSDSGWKNSVSGSG